KKPRLALEDVAGAIGALLCKQHGRDSGAGGMTGMEIHVRAAAVRPLVEPARGIGSKRKRRGDLPLIEREQICAARGRTDGSYEPCGAEKPGKLRIEKRPTDTAPHFVADDGGLNESRSSDALPFGQCKERRPDHDAVMRDRGCVHVLTHEAM